MTDTIAAIATAFGEGGIGIVRISGEEALPILSHIFKEKQGSVIESFDDRHLYYGVIKESGTGELIDECLAVYMKGPKSYTGEDVAEIHCHGSVVSLRRILSLALFEGARIADRGEFTKRAFLNGRLDLSEAEAVIDLIKAKTDKAYDTALSQMEGSLSCAVKEMRKNLLDVLVDVTVNLDYPDEDIEALTYENLKNRLKIVMGEVDSMLKTAAAGKIISEGLGVAIIGKPNVGKSSLMNALSREVRAIVTEIPGTTRDTVEELISVRGIPIKLIDTAGIRETDDVIERIGIEKSKEKFNEADLILFLLEAHRNLEEEDFEIMEKLRERKVIVLLNKSDLGMKLKKKEIENYLPGCSILETAVSKNQGINRLEECIAEMVYEGEVKQEESLLITNVRHERLLIQAKNALTDAIHMTNNREALDFIEVDIRSAWDSLGEIIGETVSEDIIDEVFSRFCLGK